MYMGNHTNAAMTMDGIPNDKVTMLANAHNIVIITATMRKS